MSSDNSTSWAPDEPPAIIWLEQSIMAGVGIGNIAYGVHMTLFFMCFAAWWSGRKTHPKHAYLMLGYITCVFVVGSVGNGEQMRVLQLAFVDDRNFPGGPGAFEEFNGSILPNVVGTAAYCVNAWLADGLMLGRFVMLWSTSARYWWLTVPPFLAYILSIISSCILLAQISSPGGALYQHISANMALTFWSASVAVTVYTTVGIVAKLFVMRFQVRRLLGKQERSPYFSVAAMLIESAMLYTCNAIAFIVTYARGDTVSLLLIAILGQVQSIAPLLIVLRVAQGRGWTASKVKETERLTTVQSGRGIPLSFMSPAMSAANASATLAGTGGKEHSFSESDSAKGVKIEQVVVMD